MSAGPAKIVFACLRDEKGIVLVISLLIMALLIGAGVGAIVSMQTDFRTAANLKTLTQSLYLAEAGIERAKKTVKESTSTPPVTQGSCAAAESLGEGTFTVCYPTVATSGSGADTTYTVTIRSSGDVGDSTKTIDSAVRKSFVLSQAAISFTGNEADSSFSGTAFQVDGNNWDYNSSTGAYQKSGSARLGISVASTTQKTTVDSALSSSQKSNITGSGSTTPSLDVGTNFSQKSVSQLATDFCNLASSANKFTTPTNGTLTIAGNETWGTRSSPEIRCYTGVGTPGMPSVDVRGNVSGAGVLVINGSDFVARGAFDWQGLIIVTGAKVGIGFLGGGSRTLYGSIFINETDYDPVTYRELVLQGSTNVRYSESALKLAYAFLPIGTLASLLPSTVSTVYWKEILN
jgi:Tfp pilus assembly protein PilX